MKSNMKKLLIGSLIGLIFLSLVYIFFYMFQKSEELQESQLVEDEIQIKLESFHPYKVNDCEIIMVRENRTHALCCMNSRNIIYPCDVKTSFSAGEYIGLQVNIQTLNKYFDSYYACTYSDIPIFKTVYPQKYGNITPKKVIDSEFECSELLYQNDYHHYALSGFVLDMPGEYTITRIWLFDGSYPEDFDFQGNLDMGVIIFDLMGEIK